ncbi:hypothetical protein MKSMC1_54160 [Mycobacterium kansasii]|nr:hypothetical protein MKSMC1_54160 [Mycobacterium kansasii]
MPRVVGVNCYFHISHINPHGYRMLVCARPYAKNSLRTLACRRKAGKSCM